MLGALLLNARPGQALTLTDMQGRHVSLDALPRRIVSLVPSVTELLFALGAEDRLIGVTDYCDFPPAARRKASVGGMVAPSLEGIVALRPDLVVATDAGTRRETFEQLGRLNVPVYLVHADRMAQVMDVITRLGGITERQADAEALKARLTERI
jgi:iron complex transport system substrate-binding protein